MGKKGANYKIRGVKHPNWKDGRSPFFYRRIAFRHYGKRCNRCGSEKFLTIHHKDGNKNNNHIQNLEVLCRSCHAKEHNVVENFKEAFRKMKRDVLGRFAGYE